MNVIRKQEMAISKASDYQIGDQIQVGKYTAICQKVTDSAAIFLLDQYLDKAYQMNPTWTNEGGYEASALRATIASADFVASDENFVSIRDHLVPFSNGDLLRIPTVGEMFGNDDLYEMDDAEQWELMKNPRNRIAYREGMEYEWGWLQNQVLESAAYFAAVSGRGYARYGSASAALGVRPVFQLAD